MQPPNRAKSLTPVVTDITLVELFVSSQDPTATTTPVRRKL